MKSKTNKKMRRKKGEGTIYKMKDGRYGAAVSFGKTIDGKRDRKIITGKTEEIVTEKMKAFLKKVGAVENRKDDSIINDKTLVEDFVREFKLRSLLRSKIASRTYENYEFALSYFEEYFNGRSIGSVDTLNIDEFFEKMEDARSDTGEYTYSQVTLNRIKYIVERMFKRACNKGYISNNPFNDEDFNNPKSKKEKQKIVSLSKNEIKSIYKALQNNKLVFPVIQLMFGTGMRTQEALGLKWKYVDLDNGIIKVRKAITLDSKFGKDGTRIERHTILSTTKKGSGDREIYIDKYIIDVLKKWKKDAPTISKTGTGDDDYVFGNSKNKYWTYSGFRTTLNRCLKRNTDGMNGLRLHRIRHTVATSLANGGASLYELMQLLGHSQAETTMKYIDKASNSRAKNNRDRLYKCLTKELEAL
ncbi:site-specific integrase [Clostridium autoethanogenum]|uniref:Site-specific integrase n=1 Tax=Clostridium autoethanogenum TaxID=84023 RepID=A0A3M0SJ29_9CLOT|nr:site-specific integrase [Clostridium autoethanogenum]RMC97800.1 site-specific integrase [Clostridium autoethanogenum]